MCAGQNSQRGTATAVTGAGTERDAASAIRAQQEDAESDKTDSQTRRARRAEQQRGPEWDRTDTSASGEQDRELALGMEV
eukprot:SAG31_NODE_2830_length_5027_cov_3.418425_1_plen_80_part_00